MACKVSNGPFLVPSMSKQWFLLQLRDAIQRGVFHGARHRDSLYIVILYIIMDSIHWITLRSTDSLLRVCLHYSHIDQGTHLRADLEERYQIHMIMMKTFKFG